ncbi:MAG: 6-bladed beta-propeller [Spirochaetaceae bacterium]|nr:MAG: 6-bladed beta-propeller [Spirochaetaceae bacterium]
MQTVSRRLGRAMTLIALLGLGLLPAGPMPAGANPLDMDSAEAAEEFRWGVVAFHNGRFNEAILSFTRALSFVPHDPTARIWLGHAFYRSGFEQAALVEWQTVVDAGHGNQALDKLIEIVDVRRGVARELFRPERYVVTAEIAGVVDGDVRFRRPTSVRPRPDGSFFVTAFTEREILHLDANGALRRRLRGGLAGFDQPFDILEVDGGLYVSEFGADRIARVSERGDIIGSFGTTGIAEGQLLGPQYLAADRDGAIYVTDYGNRRVVKFDPDGRYVLSFGGSRGAFEGLENPTGIAVLRDEVYVADAARRAIFRFDRNGNFLGAIRDLGLTGPESIVVYDRDHLLISDSAQVALLEVENQVVSHPADLSALSGVRITSIARDANGNLIAADFDRNRVYFLADISSIYAGLHVHVERVYAEQFPEIAVEVSVSDRLGRPIVGLDSGNFVLTERNRRLELPPLAFAGYRSRRVTLSLLIDHSLEMDAYRDAIEDATVEIFDATTGDGVLRVVSAGADPSVVAPTGSGRLTAVQAARRGPYSPVPRFDSALRLAAAELVPHQDRRAVVFVTDGRFDVEAFAEYGLGELAAYLRNNHIMFSVVSVRQGAVDPELEFLVAETGGEMRYVYAAEGVAGVVARARTVANGRYILRYTSGADTDFGRAYLPLTVEAYLVQRSGRGESGYFGPLEF